MGMYSYYDSEDTRVTDWEGLKRAVEGICKVYREFEKKEGNEDYSFYRKLFEGTLDKKNKQIQFGDWDDMKLISYWYDDVLYFFEAIAPYVEGRVNWKFENDDEVGYIEFENGKVCIITGVMNYSTWEPSEEIRKENKELHKRMIRLIGLNKLEKGNV